MKKISVLLIIITMALTCNLPVLVLSQDTEVSVEAETLQALSIIKGDENGELNLNDNVTRAEFCTMIINLLGISEEMLPEDNEMLYYDILQGHWASRYIKMASTLEIVDGSDEGYFYPEHIVTYEQAVKMIMSSFGYKTLAETKGGYPTGYLVYANESGLTKGIKLSIGDTLTRGDVIKLLYQSLNIRLIKQTTFSDKPKFSISDDTTPLTYYHDAKIIKGIVDKTEISGLLDSAGLGENEISIDGDIYKTNFKNAEDYLGYQVEGIAKKDDVTDEYIAILLNKVNNRELIIKAKDLLLDEASFTASNIVYSFDGVRKREAKLKDADVIYNGSSITNNYGKESFDIKNGEIKLIDNDNDGKYEVVFIEAYENYLVSYVTEKEIVSDNGEVIKLLSESEGKVIVKDVNDYTLKVQDIKKDDIISVFISENEKVLKIYLSREYIEGRITELVEEDNDLFALIGGNKYKVNKQFLNSSKYQIRPLGINEVYMLYLDFKGEIANFEYLTGSQSKIGFLFKAGTTRVVDKYDCFVRIFKSDATFENIKLAEYVFVPNETGSKDRLLAKSVLDNYLLKSDGKIKGQFVVYELNNNGEISQLETESIFLQNSNIKFNKRLDDVYYKRYGTLGFQYIVNADTKIFSIPEPDEDGNYLEDYFEIKANSSLVHDNKYTCDIYNASPVNVAGIIRMYPGAGSADSDYDVNIAVIDKITEAVDSDGLSVSKIYLYHNGKSKELFADEKIKFIEFNKTTLSLNPKEEIKNLKKGDIIALNISGLTSKITGIRGLYRISDTFEPKILRMDNNPNPDLNTALSVLLGNAVTTEKNVVLTKVESIFAPLSIASAYVYLIDCSVPENPKISLSSLAYVKPAMNSNQDDGSKIISSISWSQVRDIIIIND